MLLECDSAVCPSSVEPHLEICRYQRRNHSVGSITNAGATREYNLFQLISTYTTTSYLQGSLAIY